MITPISSFYTPSQLVIRSIELWMKTPVLNRYKVKLGAGRSNNIIIYLYESNSFATH